MSKRILHCRDIFVCCSASYGISMRIYCLLIFIMRKRFRVLRNVSRSTPKFIRGCCSERAFSGYVSLPKNFMTIPSCDFCIAHRYRKINKGLRAVSCEADESVDSESKWLLHLLGVSRLQPSLLRIRLMWL